MLENGSYQLYDQLLVVVVIKNVCCGLGILIEFTRELYVSLESSSLSIDYLTMKPHLVEPYLHNPCLFNHVSLTFVLILLSNLG